MAVLSSLTAAKEVLAAQIISLTTALTATEDNTSVSIDGVSYTRQHVEDKLDKALASLERLNGLIQVESQPIEVISYGYPQ